MSRGRDALTPVRGVRTVCEEAAGGKEREGVFVGFEVTLQWC